VLFFIIKDLGLGHASSNGVLAYQGDALSSKPQYHQKTINVMFHNLRFHLLFKNVDTCHTEITNVFILLNITS
jgi:hypothetical protein